MLVKALGTLDLFIGISFFLVNLFNLNANNFILIIGVILLVKGLIFSIGKDIISIIDVLVAIIILISLSVSFPFPIIVIIGFYLVQKGIFSLIN